MTGTPETDPARDANPDARERRVIDCCSVCISMPGKCRRRLDDVKEFAGELDQHCREFNVKQKIRKLITVDELKSRLPILTWIPKYRYADCRCRVPVVFDTYKQICYQVLLHSSCDGT